MGGVPVNTLVRNLLDTGCSVTLFTASIGLQEDWRASGDKLSIVAAPYRSRARDRAIDFFRQERKALARELRDCQADIFHAHWTYEFALACVDARVGPVLVAAHDAPLTILRYLPDWYRFLRACMALRVSINTRHLTAVSPYLAERWRKEMLYRSRIEVISNPVPHTRLSLSVSQTHPIILEVADGSPRKNMRTSLRAFADVRKLIHTSELRLVGGGLRAGSKMESWAHDRNLADGVKFLRNVDRDEVARHFAEATLFCHASREESQGICLVEAMHARLQIIAGAHSGAVPWTLFGGRAGRLVDVRGPDENGTCDCFSN